MSIHENLTLSCSTCYLQFVFLNLSYLLIIEYLSLLLYIFLIHYLIACSVYINNFWLYKCHVKIGNNCEHKLINLKHYSIKDI